MNVVVDNAPVTKFRFVAGACCLDFCNTVGGKREGRAKEKLHSYADLISWGMQAGLTGAGGILLRKAAGDPNEAETVLVRARELREAIYRIFFSIFHGRKPPRRDLDLLNAELGRSLNRLRVGSDRNGYHWEWTMSEPGLDDLLGPIARSAAELLISNSAFEKIRQCQGDNCGWLFLDSSKNHSRCWCDMRDCGNLAKVRRHRQKQRREGQD